MIRILIVEDEKPISNLIRLSLTKAGYHCTCVYDGNAAVDKLDREIFDLILLDIMLPGANGFELMDYMIISDLWGFLLFFSPLSIR